MKINLQMFEHIVFKWKFPKCSCFCKKNNMLKANKYIIWHTFKNNFHQFSRNFGEFANILITPFTKIGSVISQGCYEVLCRTQVLRKICHIFFFSSLGSGSKFYKSYLWALVSWKQGQEVNACKIILTYYWIYWILAGYPN